LTTAYLDTSAAAKLLTEEPESAGLAAYLDRDDVDVVACLLLETELRRFCVRNGIPQSDATALLDNVSLFDMPRSLFFEAGILPGRQLRSLDALHVAAAVRLGVDVLISYNSRLAEHAAELGLKVLAVPAIGA
jgi:uncharacterized protein